MYTCPMHPEIRKEAQGICPECGMKLIPISERGEFAPHKDFSKHEGHRTNVFRSKFWVSLVLTIPVLAYSETIQKLLGFSVPTFSGSEYIPLIASSIIFFYGGWVFISSAYRELKAKLPGMMTLISLAIVTAYTYSVYAVLTGGKEALFWELSTLITVMLLGHWMEMRAVSGAQSALKELSKLLPDQAEVIRADKTEIIPLADVKENDLLLVKPGAKIPADGIVVGGSSEVNESVATGESKPVPKNKNSEVIAGTINGDGSLKIKVTKIGENTFLAGVMRLVAEAQSSKSRLQVLSDKAAFALTIIAVVVGGITLISWLFISDPSFAVERMVAVLVIACPHALGLAIPLVASISTTKAARNGFLVKQRLSLEAARNIDVILFDKTGTLTKGEFGVSDVYAVDRNIDPVLWGASVNRESEHPLAKALAKDASEKERQLKSVTNFKRIAGKGVQGMVDGRDVFAGSEVWLKENSVVIPDNAIGWISAQAGEGKSVNHIVVDKKYIGSVAFADQIRDESREAIKMLKAMNIRSAMITGDSEDVARWVAEELGIDEYFARVLPDQKSEKVKLLQAKGQKVAMVGDGVNDAPALTQADLGIAVGAGTNVAIESAGIILVRNDPRDIPKVIKLSKMTYAKMIQNLFWATGYNIVAIPLAAGVLAYKGILLQPALAAVFMSLSTVIVAVNAILLKKRAL